MSGACAFEPGLLLVFLSPIFLPFPSVMAALLRIVTNILSSNHLITMRYLLPRAVITPEYLRLFLPISSSGTHLTGGFSHTFLGISTHTRTISGENTIVIWQNQTLKWAR